MKHPTWLTVYGLRLTLCLCVEYFIYLIINKVYKDNAILSLFIPLRQRFIYFLHESAVRI